MGVMLAFDSSTALYHSLEGGAHMMPAFFVAGSSVLLPHHYINLAASSISAA